MPVATPQAPSRPLIPAGEHTLTLQNIEVKELEDKKYNPGTMRDRWLWHFLSDMRDPDGAAYEFTLFTGTSYGPPQAALTGLYDSLMPGISVEQATTKFNSDYLCGERFKCAIKHETNEKGEARAKLVRIEWLLPAGQDWKSHLKTLVKRGIAQPAAKPAPAAPPVDDDNDPFSDE